MREMSHFLEPKSKMSSIVNFDQELADLLQVEERLLFIIKSRSWWTHSVLFDLEILLFNA